MPVDPSELTFGTNGYHLKFDEANLLGKSSNSTTNPTVSFLGSHVDAVDRQIYTVSGASLGTAASNRSIVVAVGGGRANAGVRTITSLTVGGTAATEIVRSVEGGNDCMYFFIVEKASDTSGDIVATFSGGNNQMNAVGFAWWRVLDAGQPISIGTATGSSWATLGTSTIGQTGDVALYALFDSPGVPAAGSNAPTGYSWSDATERAEHLNITSGPTDGTSGTHLNFVAADYTFDAAESHTETVTIGGGQGNETSYAAITLSNNNTFTGNSLAAANQVTDTCTDDDPTTGNYATLNSLDLASSTVLSNGNLRCTSSSNTFDQNHAFSTIAMSTGKFYVTSLPTDTGKYLGIANASVVTGDISTSNDVEIYWDSSAPRMVYWNGSNNNLTPSPTEVRGTDQLGIALNATNGDYWIGWYDISGSAWYWYNSSASNWTGNPDNDSGKSGTLSGGPYRFMIGCNASGTHDIDFGQGTLWDNITELTNFKQLNTANLPAPTVTNPSDFFKTVLYTANNSDGHEISTVGFVPDFVWIKDRDTVASHVIFDVVRGVSPSANNYVTVNTNDAENQGSFTNTMVQLGKAANGSTVINGFTLDDDSNDQRVNYGGAMVAWCWKAGGSPSTLAVGSISSGVPSIASSVSAASHGGFSIITYTGNGSAGATIGHGLSKAAEFQMFRRRNTGNDFHVGTNITGSIIGAELNNTTNSIGGGAVGAAVTAFNATTTALAASGVVNDVDDTYVSYAFARTPGFIGIGAYTGNGSANGPMVVVDDGASGFRPAWVMCKRIDSTGNWAINDSARSTYNPTNLPLFADQTAADGSGINMDFIANGFKIRDSSTTFNASGGTYIYLAFAEQPFGGATVAQARAR